MTFAIVLVVAALTGFCAISSELLWYRAFAFLTGGSAASFGMLLAYYLVGIGAGALLGRARCRTHSATGDRRQLLPLAAFVAIASMAGFLVVPALARLAISPGLAAVQLTLVMGAAALSGAVLPLVSHFGVAADARAGSRVAWVYFLNILGSATGSLVTGFVLMDAWPLRTVSVALLLVGLALAGTLAATSGLSGGRLLGVAGAGAAIAGLLLAATPALFGRVWERLLYKQTFSPDVRFAEVVENRAGVITVSADGAVYGGGAYDGVVNTSLRDNRNHIARAFALGALHPAPRAVMMVGLSSGSWAQVIAHLPRVEHLTVVEINPGYVGLVGRHAAVASLLENPHVDIVVDDARRWLLRNPGARFDAIVMNTTWHWRAHVTSLLSAEFMQLARRHLEPGGVFYFNTTGSADVQKTGVTVFPHALLVGNFLAASDTPLVFDRERWRRTLAATAIDGRPVFDPARVEDRLALERFVALADGAGAPEPRDSIVARTASATVVTDDNMVAEWRRPFNLPVPGTEPAGVVSF